MNGIVFSRGYLRDFLQERQAALKATVGSLPEKDILSRSEADLAEELADEYSLELPTLDTGAQYAEGPSEVTIDARRLPNRAFSDTSRPISVPGIAVTVTVPVSGSLDLLHYRPSAYSLSLPAAHLDGSELRFRFEGAAVDQRAITAGVASATAAIREMLRNVGRDLGGFNEGIKAQALAHIQGRKTSILDARKAVAELGIPLRRRDVPDTFVVPQVRKRVVTKPAETPRRNELTEAFVPEPTLEEAEYEHILKIVLDAGLLMERNPHTFEKFAEEDIRNTILLLLNGHYEGNATGETFNAAGKTDILIRDEGNNLFIAECKFWKGEGVLLKAIDQLLSYTTWRDTKTALVVFVRDTSLTTAVAALKAGVPKHSCFKRAAAFSRNELRQEGVFRYTLHRPDDRDREVHCGVLVLHIPPVKSSDAASGRRGSSRKSNAKKATGGPAKERPDS